MSARETGKWRNVAEFARSVWEGVASVIGNPDYEARSASSGPVNRRIIERFESRLSGEVADEWSPAGYGEYYARSSPVHAAVRVLAEAVSRPKLEVWQRSSLAADFEPAGSQHPMQRILDRPNRFWSSGELWRAVESRLALWGSSFIAIGRDERGAPTELWPLPSHQVRALFDDDDRLVRGFVHETIDGSTAYLPEDIVWFRRFNPMKPLAGMSSVAPARAAIDMGSEALRFNRRFFLNSASPSDLVMTMDSVPTSEQIEAFYDAWSVRLRDAGTLHRPLVLSPGMDVKRLGMTHRDMEFMAALEWSVEEVKRSFGVPKVFLSEFEDATLANVRTMEQFLWRNTIIPELRMLEDGLNLHLASQFAEFPGELQARFDLSSIEAVQETATARAERLVSLVSAGIMDVNEARGELGLSG